MSKIRQLHSLFTPKNYSLKLTLLRPERRFEGTATIIGTLPKAAHEIALHAKDLTITRATIDSQPAKWQTGIFDELTLRTESQLPAGEHTLTLAFSGTITNPMNGLYPCYFKLDGKDEELLATQFESHHARQVFPCIDEPAAKATFDLSLTTEPDVTVIANTPVASQTITNGRLTTSFETTPVMSTYLLAWVIGKLAYTEAKTKGGVVVRAYATPDKVEKTHFALDVAVHTLDFYNEYFDIAYPLPKCDMVALPDFSSGAMENWGCITFRESSLLVDAHTAIGTKQWAATTVAHELAHQWFGNLVTMQWWNDLWLNESFANWIEYLALDHLHPQWQMWTQFYDHETAHALDRDSLANVQKVRQEVNNPDEIRTLFDPAIVYAKGSALLHMLHAYIGADSFRDGLRIYLKRHQFANAQADDLWQALSEASTKDVGSFMQPWISQSGHPVVRVEADDKQVILRQQRFYTNSKEAAANGTTLWPVPLLAATLPQVLFDQPTLTLQRSDPNAPLLLNQGRTGFYLTSYSPKHVLRLADEVRDGRLAVLDRLGLLSEAYDLAKAGQQPTLQLLQLLEAYRNESSEPVWGAIADAVGALKMFINEDEALKPFLQRFTATLARSQFERLGWTPKPNEAYFDELLRPTIAGLMCYAEDSAALQYTKQVFAQAERPEDILGDIRGIIFSVNAKFGGKEAFDKLLGWYHNQPSAELRAQLTAGLSSTRDQQLIGQLLTKLTTKEVKLQDLFYWFVYLMRNHYARPATWQWMQDNWAWIAKNFGNDMHYTDFPRYSAGAFSTAAELEQYKQFFEPKLDQPALARDIKQGIEAIESRVMWRERAFEPVLAYLKQFSGESKAATSRL